MFVVYLEEGTYYYEIYKLSSIKSNVIWYCLSVKRDNKIKCVTVLLIENIC